MDPQSNLTSGVGLRSRAAPSRTIYQALTAAEVPEIAPFLLSTEITGLSVLPSDRNLTGAEIELVSLSHREQRLRPLVHQVREQFDYVIIDTPPSLGLLTLNALVAADAALIPLHCEYFALEGLADLVGTLRRVRAGLNPTLDIAGVLLTMYDERTNLGQQVGREIRVFFKEKVFQTVIPRNVRLGEAPSHGKPAILYDVKSRGPRRTWRSLAKSSHGTAVSGNTNAGVNRKVKTQWPRSGPALGRGLSALIPETPERPAAPLNLTSIS